MLPYLEPPTFQLPLALRLDAFAVLSSAGVVLGYLLAVRAARRYGPGDEWPLREAAPWAIGGGLAGARFLHVFAYHPELLHSPSLTLLTLGAFVALAAALARSWPLAAGRRWSILVAAGVAYYLIVRHVFPDRAADFVTTVKLWEGRSSLGGAVGALLAFAICFRRQKVALTPYLDAMALGTAPGWALARVGCFLEHHHPGVRSDFPLAVAYPGGARHDLGIYDALVLAGISLALYALARRRRETGLLIGVLAASYAAARFLLDFLRATDFGLVDARYAGFTPAQYIAMPLFAVGATLIWRSRSGTSRAGHPLAA
jgi:phosphatidylglycerol:prolipoprotein diacylglycerol transferase